LWETTAEDGTRGAVVALQLHHPRIREVPRELQDVPDVGAPPAVDGLVRVPHDAEVAVLGHELAHQAILHAVRVLVLVHQHVLPAPAVGGEHLGEPREELRGLEDQVAEIQGVLLR